jgi:hypothetical protein
MTARLARVLLLLGLTTVVATASSRAATIDPAAMAYTLPTVIEWRDNPNNPGVKSAVLYGDPAKPGPYVVRVKWLPGNMSRPHSHPNDRFIVVLSGTWWAGTGEKFDPENTIPMPAGSFVTHFGGKVHYDGAKDEEAILQIHGMGPATTTYVHAGH